MGQFLSFYTFQIDKRRDSLVQRIQWYNLVEAVNIWMKLQKKRPFREQRSTAIKRMLHSVSCRVNVLLLNLNVNRIIS